MSAAKDVPQEDRELLVGVHPVREMLAAHPGRIHRIHLLKGRRDARFAEIVEVARGAGIPVTPQGKEALDRLAGGSRHQGVVAHLTAQAYLGLDDLLRQVEDSDSEPLLLVLDQLNDPHNLGAIARTASGVGAHGLIVPERGSAPPGAGAYRASAGALSRIPLCRVTNIAQTLDRLKESGFWVVGTAAVEGTPPWELQLTGPIAVVIGGEKKGIRPGVRKRCDMIASVPLAGGTESLNASVAAGMILYEVVRQRG